MSPFEAAWALLKAEAFIGDPQDSMGVFASKDREGYLQRMNPQMYNPAMARFAGREVPNPADAHLHLEEDAKQHAGIGGGDFGMASTNNVDYYRGGSMPRPAQSGRFVGVNVANPDFDFVNNFDTAVDKFAETAAHENIHDMIDEEISPWAVQQSGVSRIKPVLDIMQQSELAGLTGMDYWNRNKELAQETDTPYAQMRDAHNAAMDNANRLRSFGHEYGAFSAERPDTTQEQVYGRMMNYPDIQPYVQFAQNQMTPNLAGGFGLTGIDPAHLHTADPSIHNTATPL